MGTMCTRMSLVCSSPSGRRGGACVPQRHRGTEAQRHGKGTNAAILNVASSTNRDQGIVPTHHCIEPDGAVLFAQYLDHTKGVVRGKRGEAVASRSVSQCRQFHLAALLDIAIRAA
jgi:hypothetical protein